MRIKTVVKCVFVAAVVIYVLAVTPSHKLKIRVCRDCLAKELQESWVFASKTTVDPGKFAAWFESQNPGHVHEWWTTSDTQTFCLGGKQYSSFTHGYIYTLPPGWLLKVAEKSPADYEHFRKVILSPDTLQHREAIEFIGRRYGEILDAEPATP